jgi:Na+-transporting methylmalonyl-CoA/oxaloacetate decarboxylase gamma subunit
MAESEDERTVRQRVEVEDPEFSPRANEILTDEVRESLGTDEVEVPADRADSLGREDLAASGATVSSKLMRSRMVIGMIGAALLIVGLITTLATGSWVFLVITFLAFAVALGVVTMGAIESTTNVEQPSPERVEELEAEGVDDPEEVLNTAIRSYSGAQASATDEATDSDEGSDDTGSRPFESPGTGTVQQQSAQTPSSNATEGGDGGESQSGGGA